MNRWIGFLAALLLPSLAWASDLRPQHLKCEFLIDPLGIDVANPRLSWVLESDERGQRQTAYQIIVAASAQPSGNSDVLWDTGKVASDQTIQIEYAGKPLISCQHCLWRVRVWDKDGRESAWSEPANWSMGLLQESDWSAQWITDGHSATYVMPARVKDGVYFMTVPNGGEGRYGYQSQIGVDPNLTKVVEFDLGAAQPLDSVKLWPACARPYGRVDIPGFGFPSRFRLEAANKADFSDRKIVFDRTSEDVKNPGAECFVCIFDPVVARYIRLVTTRLRGVGIMSLALAQMQVTVSGRVLAPAHVTCTDSMELPHEWGLAYLTDGQVTSNKVPEPENSGQHGTMVRKTFKVNGSVRRATAYVTARGLYELHVNGSRAGNQVFAPGWTEYDDRIIYQTVDVTKLIQEGQNAVGAILGAGWYAGSLGPIRTLGRRLYGAYPELLMRLEIEKADGSTQTIVTDGSWAGTDDGQIRFAEIYDGEDEDGRRSQRGWDTAEFKEEWPAVHARELDKTELDAQMAPPVRITQELQARSVLEPAPRLYQFDFGQCFAGWCRIKIKGVAGQRVVFHYFEKLGSNKLGDRSNLFGARAEDSYVCRGDPGGEVFEPKFTYHGFRYLEISGLNYTPKASDAVAQVMRSDAPIVGQIETDNDMLNKLMHAILWTQMSNMPSIPSDCPQRNERLGWMGDIQAFAQTSIYNMDMAAFFEKWLRDIRDSQFDNGAFTNLSPHHFIGSRNSPIIINNAYFGPFAAAPAWADAGVTIPWDVYVNYSDKRLLQVHYEAARRWVDYIHGNNPDTLLFIKGRGEEYGDWMGADPLDMTLFATAFFAHSTETVAKMANALGKEDEARTYNELFRRIKAAFSTNFIQTDGTLKARVSGYALALWFNLYPDEFRAKAVESLYALINGQGLPTGIQSTHRLMLELSRDGHHDEAGRLLNLHIPEYSWGYMIDKGATTVWENWKGQTSLNHYALGAVGEWVWRDIAGLNPDPDQPGYKHFFVRPLYGAGVSSLKSSYDSIRGLIAIAWKTDGLRATLDVTIPPNTTANVYIPAKDASAVTESGGATARSVGVHLLRTEGGFVVFVVDSGKYEFATGTN